MTTYTSEAVYEMLETNVTAALEKAGLEHLADAIDWDTAAELEIAHRGWEPATNADGDTVYRSEPDPDRMYDTMRDRWAS